MAAIAVSLALLALACGCRDAPAQDAPRAIVGVDHVPLAVRDLDRAAATYRQLGFVIKPGRAHANGIRNAHVKFPDGSGIELITASRGDDPLSADYLARLADGEGPAFIAFHARDTAALTHALAAGGFAYTEHGGTVTLAEPALHYVFFVRDNRAPTDTPAHFAHPNAATAMTRVWIADSGSAPLRRLLTSLGAAWSEQAVRVPGATAAAVAVATLADGDVVLLPEALRRLPDRPVVGVTFSVTRLAPVTRRLAANGVATIPDGGASSLRGVVVPAGAAHGAWLEFRESR